MLRESERNDSGNVFITFIVNNYNDFIDIKKRMAKKYQLKCMSFPYCYSDRGLLILAAVPGSAPRYSWGQIQFQQDLRVRHLCHSPVLPK